MPGWSERRLRRAGIAAIIGGVGGVLLAPIMVIVKYMTGWSIVPEPAWVGVVRPAIDPMLSFATPVGLWVVYGSLYTVALLLMFTGLLAFSSQIKNEQGRAKSRGIWVLLLGLLMVIPGDAVHTLTWHQNGLTIPTPGSNIVANSGYAVHMMGMNLVLVGSLVIGITALRKRFLAPWLAWMFVSIAPSAVIVSLTLLPTSPSGGLWVFSLMMIMLGETLGTDRTLPARNW